MFDNPFIECTARDMEYEDVTNYWCQPYEFYEGLDEKALISSTTPIFIEGARGSGKTMILKHLSYFCQKKEIESAPPEELLDYFAKKGSLGIYYRFKNDFGKLLAALTCQYDIQREVFEEYFQLYYTRELFFILRDLYSRAAISEELIQIIVAKAGSLFSKACKSCDELIEHVNSRIDRIDMLIRRWKYSASILEEIPDVLTGKPFIIEVQKIVRESIAKWEKINLLILVDEYENISAFQSVVNTYVKQTEASSGITYRIGMRPETATYRTCIGNEQLQNGRDFLLVQLRVTNQKSFQRFLKIVAEKRLQKSSFFGQHKLTKIEKILGVRESWVDEARQAVKNRPNIVLESIGKNVIEKYGMSYLTDLLKYPDDPLIEMLNVLWVNRGKTPEYTNEAMNLYLEAKKAHNLDSLSGNGRKYYLDYDMKYRYSLLFVLLAKCGIRKKYYSFTTFSYLSCGSVNDFLSLCRNTFMAIDQNGYDCILSGRALPMTAQDHGARETASEQLDKIRLCEDSGTEMYTFAMNIGEIFSYYHRDAGVQFPETNQFAFANEAELESRSLLKRNLSLMIKWGVIEKRSRTQYISVGRRKGNIYALSKMLAPVFNLSYRTRGGYNFVIKTDVFEQMLSNSMDAKSILSKNKQRKVPASDAPTSETVSEGQMSFFEEK